MIQLRDILCPTDFSDVSRHALEHALVLARWYDATITALYVVHVPLVPHRPILAAGFIAGAEFNEANCRTLEEELRAWLKPAFQQGIRTDVVVADGNAARRILDHARARSTDLIVMGTHGLSGFERVMLGSVAEKVLHQAPCPVMTVPPAAHTTARVPYRRLLCPVDFSESSEAALGVAISLAGEADANLTILHVLDWPPDDELLVERFDAAAYRHFVDERARDRLGALVTDDVRTWCKPCTETAYGKPYREILRVAAQDATDLIVMGVHGRNVLDRTLFGSTTNHVVRRAPCPVLTIRR